MTDYTELVKKLRDLHRDPRPASAVWLFDNQIALYDAAAAIEELQAQLPKRGEWEREMDVNDEPFYQCSVCGECFDFNSDSTHEVFNYCPNCGADMRKMEVQDGKRCD